jgi:hypothetical protein
MAQQALAQMSAQMLAQPPQPQPPQQARRRFS